MGSEFRVEGRTGAGLFGALPQQQQREVTVI